MYESHFGLTGAPFGLNPDPTFFFGSKGHSHALSYLKFGVYQSEGFVVVTGDIGAGKTTLVATLLSGLDKERIVSAQIVSTQLEAGDLLRSVALAFGIAPKSLSKAELIATIEAFLTVLVTHNKRALLIVDEAQNLSREAVEELRMLSNFQLGSRALLQSFLVGQPELRTLLTSKPMEQFRQRVIASCHLGPMDVRETQAYIEHRLHQVGWRGDNPTFGTDAFGHIFRWTAGVPRRVNQLCNRLLLWAYLSSQSVIDGPAVDFVGEEARGEVGDAAVTPTSATPVHAKPAGTAVDGPWPVLGLDKSAGGMPSKVTAHAEPRRRSLGDPLVLIAADTTEDVKMARLAHSLKQQAAITRPLLCVRMGEPASFAENDELLGLLGLAAPTLAIETIAPPGAAMLADVLTRFAALIDEQRPHAVIVGGNSDAALGCALSAAKKACRVIRIDAGCRGAGARVHDTLNAALIDRIADIFYANDATAYANLLREGLHESKVCCAGDPMTETARESVAHLKPAVAVLARHMPPAMAHRAQSGYGLVSLDSALLQGSRESIAEWLSKLHEIASSSLLLWPMTRAVNERLLLLGLRDMALHENIAVMPSLALLASLSLLKGAAFVIADSRDVQIQAAVLGVRCLAPTLEQPRRLVLQPPLGIRDDQATHAIAEHLAHHLGEADLVSSTVR